MKTIHLSVIAAIAVVITASSCEVNRKLNANKKAGIIKLHKRSESKRQIFWSHFDASKRASLIVTTPDGHVRVLAENAPDAAYASTVEMVNKATVKAGTSADVSAESQYKLATEVVQMGKRTATVNILRDALYRISEMYYNTIDMCDSNNATLPQTLTARDYIALYDSVLKTTERVAYSEFKLAEQEAKIAEAEALAKKADVDKLKFTQDSTKLASENGKTIEVLTKAITDLKIKLIDMDAKLSADEKKSITALIDNFTAILKSLTKTSQ